MSLTPVTVVDFPGLNWLADPEDSGFNGASICLDIDFAEPGTLRCRGGTDQVVTDVSPAAAMVARSDQYAVSWGSPTNEVTVYTYPTTVEGTTNVDTGSLTTYTKPGAEWIITGDTGGPLQYWDGAAWATIAASPNAYLVATWKDRVVAARTIAEPYRVYFSDPGDPTTYTDFVDLNPGDFEPISAVIPWGDYLFVFKRSRYYYFYNISVNTIGANEYNYRTVDKGVGAMGISLGDEFPPTQYAASTQGGVVFAHTTGVYMTTGDNVRKISQVLDPWFARETVTGTVDEDYPGYTGTFGGVAAVGDLVWYTHSLTTPAATPKAAGRSFVYHVPSGRWGVWSFPVVSALQTIFSAGPLLGTWSQVSLYSREYTTDDATAIAPKYRSNKSDLGSPFVKTVRKLELNGEGSATLSLFADLSTTDAGSSAVTMDTTTGRGQQSYSRRGSFFSHQIQGDGELEVSQLTYFARIPRKAGIG